MPSLSASPLFCCGVLELEGLLESGYLGLAFRSAGGEAQAEPWAWALHACRTSGGQEPGSPLRLCAAGQLQLRWGPAPETHRLALVPGPHNRRLLLAVLQGHSQPRALGGPVAVLQMLGGPSSSSASFPGSVEMRYGSSYERSRGPGCQEKGMGLEGASISLTPTII